MILYKYRSLSNLLYTLDIILNQRLYCSDHKSLNDPFEGLYTGLYHIGDDSEEEQTKFAYAVFRINESERKYNICSLSATANDVRMWSHYAEGHTGIAIEIEMPGNSDRLYEVKYKDTIHGFDGWDDENKNIIKTLTTKSKHWKYEQEYRIIHEDSYFSIDSMIKRILLGPRVDEVSKQILKKIIPKEISLVETTINPDNLRRSERFHPPRS